MGLLQKIKEKFERSQAGTIPGNNHTDAKRRQNPEGSTERPDGQDPREITKVK